MSGWMRLFQALGVAFKNGAFSFREYYGKEHDPLARDALTRVFNRPQFERRRTKLGSYALILLDIDNFKKINDYYGHSTGDVVLQAVGAVLRTASGDRVFRVGGEEFAVLLTHCTAEDAVKVAERLRETVRALEVLEGFPVTVSAGVAWSGALGSEGSPPAPAATDHEEVYRRADKALYHAKCTGRNRVARFDLLPAPPCS